MNFLSLPLCAHVDSMELYDYYLCLCWQCLLLFNNRAFLRCFLLTISSEANGLFLCLCAMFIFYVGTVCLGLLLLTKTVQSYKWSPSKRNLRKAREKHTELRLPLCSILNMFFIRNQYNGTKSSFFSFSIEVLANTFWHF